MASGILWRVPPDARGSSVHVGMPRVFFAAGAGFESHLFAEAQSGTAPRDHGRRGPRGRDRRRCTNRGRCGLRYMLPGQRRRSKDITSTGHIETTRWADYALFGLATGLATISLLGPLETETIRYRYSPSMINQGIGRDAVALFAVVPICIAAGVLVLRGHRAGPVLAFIPSVFAAYMVPQYVIGPDYLGIHGNNEQFFLFHLALFVLAVVVFVGARTTVDRQELRPATGVSDRRRSLVLFGLAAFIALGRWLPAVLDVMGGDPTSTDYLRDPLEPAHMTRLYAGHGRHRTTNVAARVDPRLTGRPTRRLVPRG